MALALPAMSPVVAAMAMSMLTHRGVNVLKFSQDDTRTVGLSGDLKPV
jgi:hypothetical protein